MKVTDELRRVRDLIAHLRDQSASNELTAHARRTIDRDLRSLVDELRVILAELDPIALPTAFFDPSNPELIGRFIAIGLVAQNSQSISDIPKFYGSGIYALYYTGRHSLYEPISGKEHPIYVGKSAPKAQGAKTVRDQGVSLSNRLREHRKSIEKAETSLSVKDFSVRYLCVQSGWEAAAEDYLIRLFRPIWNSETSIIFGIGKHGDSASTRANARSPWDIVHPGRKWASGNQPNTTVDEISKKAAEHFKKTTVFSNREEIFEYFIDSLKL